MSGINSCFMLMVAACLSVCLLANAGLGGEDDGSLFELNDTQENNSDIVFNLYKMQANDAGNTQSGASLPDNNDDTLGITLLNDDFSDLEDTDALDLGNYAYLGSYDSRTVASYSNGNLSLSNMMENSLWSSLEGTLQKTHNTAMYSDGSELLSIDELTSFSGYDLLGNQYSSRKETSVDLSNFNFPFILLSSEIILLDADDLDWQSTQTENYLLLPEMNDDLYSQISDVLANTGSTKIITFNETTDPMAALQSAGFNMSQFFGEDEMDEFMEPLRNEEMWDVIREMAQKEMDRQKAEAERDAATDFSASSGGVVCFWGYRE